MGLPMITIKTGFNSRQEQGTEPKRVPGARLGTSRGNRVLYRDSEGRTESQGPMDMGGKDAEVGSEVRSANRETEAEEYSKLGPVEEQRENILGTNCTIRVGVELG